MRNNRALLPLLISFALLTPSVHAASNDQKSKRPDFFECGISHPGLCGANCNSAGPIPITVLPDGGVKWGRQRIDQKTLVTFVDQAAHQELQPVFWIHVEGNTPYAKVAPLISMFQKRGVKEIVCVVPN